jgi:F420-dependent methylenetetrahydromethanopterin dehydrogenase
MEGKLIDRDKVMDTVLNSGRIAGRMTPSPLEAAVHEMTGRQKLDWVIATIRNATCQGHILGDRELLRKAMKAGAHAADRHKIKGQYKAKDQELYTILRDEIAPKLASFGLDMNLNPVDESSNGAL